MFYDKYIEQVKYCSPVSGEVVGSENDIALIDVGLKSEGRVSLKEFSSHGQKSEIKTLVY